MHCNLIDFAIYEKCFSPSQSQPWYLIFDLLTDCLNLILAVLYNTKLVMTDTHDSQQCLSICTPNASSDTDATSGIRCSPYFILLNILYPVIHCPKFDQKKNKYFSLVLNILSSIFGVDWAIWCTNLLHSATVLIYRSFLLCLYRPVIYCK